MCASFPSAAMLLSCNIQRGQRQVEKVSRGMQAQLSLPYCIDIWLA